MKKNEIIKKLNEQERKIKEEKERKLKEEKRKNKIKEENQIKRKEREKKNLEAEKREREEKERKKKLEEQQQGQNKIIKEKDEKTLKEEEEKKQRSEKIMKFLEKIEREKKLEKEKIVEKKNAEEKERIEKLKRNSITFLEELKKKEEIKIKEEQEKNQKWAKEVEMIQEAEKKRIIEEQKKEKEIEKEKMRKREERRNNAEKEEKRIREEMQRKREEAFKNYSKNQPLVDLNKGIINKIFGEKSKDLSNDEILHILERKINNCGIEEKLNLKITLKNPKKEYLYETEVYDDEGQLISKKEQKGDQNEFSLIDDSEIIHKFTKIQTITIVIYKHINSIEKIKTVKQILLHKLISNAKNENYVENIDNFSDNELINIGLDLPKEKEKLIKLNFDTDENGYNDANIFYCIQKGDHILFKSPICKSTYIKKSEKIKLSDLKPEFEITFYNDELEQNKIKIKTEELNKEIIENINLPNMNNLKIKISSEEVKGNNFIELKLKKGLNFDLSIAIDFTGSNLPPYFEDSLHYIDNGFMNNYEKAIRENIKIISSYKSNDDDKYYVYGFGAKLNGEFKTIFNINGDDAPIKGIENVISKYKKAVYDVEFSGGTYFSPIIKEIKRKIELNNVNHFYYHILLIISDGYIHDINETINSIIEASKFPMSIVIIGVGDNVNYDMKTLNRQNGKLTSTSTGEVLNKDIVQYVHFNDYADDLNKLTEEVLKYIPDQITDYYKDKL